MNVLFLLTDQQRYDATGYRNSWLRTPNLNRLQKDSIDCSVTYAQSPQCQPSRASIFTGRYPTAHKVWWNSIPLPAGEKTLANILRGVGYHTGYVGKLHFSERQNETPIAKHFGFDHTFLTGDWQSYCRLVGKRGVFREYYRIFSTDKWYGRLSSREHQHEEIITDRAINFIKKTPNPYFLVVSYNGPHPPYAAPPPYTQWYDPAQFSGPSVSQTYRGTPLTVEDWQSIKSQYFGVISWIDDNIGRILDAVDFNNTIIVFTSDHGDILGDHGYYSKGPFAYEGTVRVPLLFRLPGFGQLTYHFLVQHIDIVPTILDALKLQVVPGIQGRSLLRGFSENKPTNDYVLSMIGYNPRLRMIRHGHLKYWLYGDEEKCFDLRSSDEAACVVDQATLQHMRSMLLRALIQAEDPLPVPVS